MISSVLILDIFKWSYLAFFLSHLVFQKFYGTRISADGLGGAITEEVFQMMNMTDVELIEVIGGNWVQCGLGTVGGALSGAVLGAGAGTVALPVVGTVSGAAAGFWGG